MSKITNAEGESRLKQREALAYFFEKWSQLPPLVRAANAADMAMFCERAEGTEFERVERLHNAGLVRRAKVNHAFARSMSVLRMLFVELAKGADEEAEASGAVGAWEPDNLIWAEGHSKVPGEGGKP